MTGSQQNMNAAALDASQLSQLQQLTAGYSPLQLAWASGYLAAKSEGGDISIAPQGPSASVTVLYSSQTGNAKGVATQFAKQAEEAGLPVSLKNIADVKAKALKNETHLIIVTSTNGEGEPPDDALAFHEFLLGKKAPKLDNLNFGVLALGDTSYEFFCQTGKDFDERLAALGASRILDRVDCDLDYDEPAAQWTSEAIALLKEQVSTATAAAPVAASSAVAASQFDKQNPYEAELLVSQKITGRDSNKDVRHVEIDLAESGLSYQVGDALGVYFENDSELVNELVDALSFSGDEVVTVKGNELSLSQALTTELEITQTAPAFVDFWAQASASEALLALAEDKNALREFAGRHQLVDVVKQGSADIDAQTFVDTLRKITPRLYSIASSQTEVEEEVHLTVGLVAYEQDGKQRFGGASGFLSNRLEEGGKVKVFVEHNDNFRLPQDSNTPVIMIGPGTGVAPFRAFMQEREATDATGDNWMFFGDQTFTQDFLYQVEWQNYLKSGLLTKLDVAFSRDQAEKVYVQHRIKEQAQEVFQWLERGAHLYICGDADRMAKDVHNALVEVVAEQGGLSLDDAEEYLKELRLNKRYQKDVY
ncbi:assimilatory sulfite reductase (NADPH) flavoprotein subunit [Thalassotalea agarivorans]|uniref:Sulfite reductase [NADPH] flavoprotein alpha-component n=1 Tax=Thalassotalea agarivorans TaxID=349064 RepID=A0A1I0H5K2_THASX|nr:assimilatory sulfite reductase (NADPH) flavoprotein subunit [Thalassotalea agarivorans]SET79003.1 sulfite reductase (NADPH) alpha subunit [Thalassotalea agarivorans]